MIIVFLWSPTILIPMFPEIQKNVSYTHSGEFFSKLLFLSSHSKNETILHVVSDNSIQKKYLSLSEKLSIHYIKMDSPHALHEMSQNTNTIYSISLHDLQIKIASTYKNSLDIEVWKNISQDECVKKLLDLWYEFSEYSKPGSYNKLWDIIKVTFSPHDSCTINFWWDEIESLERNTVAVTQYSFYSIEVFQNSEERNTHSLKNILAELKIFCVFDNLEFEEGYSELSADLINSSLDILPQISSWKIHNMLPIHSLHIKNLEELKSTLHAWAWSVSYIYTKHSDTIGAFLEQNNFSHISVSHINSPLLTSFTIVDGKWRDFYYICDDILSRIFVKRRSKKQISADLDLLLKISPGDYIVHIDHGVWYFEWICKKELWNVSKEYLEITYKDGWKLFVPITEIHRVSKYVGGTNPPLTPLSWKVWEKKISKIREDIREIAENILKNFAERKLRVGKNCHLDSSLISSFWESFPYTYTADQQESIDQIHADMTSDKNMDRLLVGDVGFGKTEVAFNAAYLAYLNKKQILLISPLVVLAHEHYSSSIKRFSDFGMKVEVLTRLQSTAHATRVIKAFKDGAIDMIVGTHRLLSDKMQHKNLGLLIVDEEHKFWVVDKEKIKNLKKDIDILSLSATPIPRSLNLALSWVRDISLLKTPPTWRKSIETSVLEFNEALILEAWKREFARGGQIFFVHNRVSNIEVIKRQLETLFPKKTVAITHWQLPGDELEDRILAFKERKYDILLSTTVIENGIDFSNVNTIFINECQSFWISQIHQLRGRVWRSEKQWYCYLLYRKNHMWDEAAKRIQTIVNYSYLWAWFELAMKDLEIRGWGDILWIKQSGQSKEIWVSLFLKMLEEKIQELKEEKKAEENTWWIQTKKISKIRCQIDLMITAGIPDSFFSGDVDKIHFYRELELVETTQELDDIWNGFFSEEPNIPEESLRLHTLLTVQILSAGHWIIKVKKSWAYYTLNFHEEVHIDEIKDILRKDREVILTVTSSTKLRASTKEFANDGIFLKYLLRLFEWNIGNPKIKLIKKA